MTASIAAGMSGGCSSERVDDDATGTTRQRWAAVGLSAQVHFGEDGSATNGEIRPVLRIVNSGSAPIALSDLTLRYYFTRDGSSPSTSACYWAALGCDNLTHQVHDLPGAVVGADSYFEVRFLASAGTLGPGASTGDIKLAVHHSDWSPYNEGDDFSYLAGATSWTNANRVALFHENDLVWGAAAAGGLEDPGGDDAVEGSTFTLALPEGVGLHSVALGATDAVTLGDAVIVSAATPGTPLSITSVGDGETNLGTDTQIPGDVISVGTVKLRDRAIVEGNVVTGADFRHDSVWTVDGDVTQAVNLKPFTTYNWDVEFPPSNTSYLAGPQQTKTVAPGAYASLNVHPDGVLELRSGTYTMNALIAESDSKVRLDFTDGPIFLYVRDVFTFRGTLEGADPSELFIGYLGTNTADIDSPFQGTVVAPNALLRLSPVDGSGHEGSFFGRRVENDARNPLMFTPFAHWDMILPPEIIVECLTRSAAGYGAGVFGYINRLDIPVEIPEGPRNQLSATRLDIGPLDRFQPGEYRDVHSIPFRGEALEWQLSGNVVRVDDDVERCTFDDYTVVQAPEVPERLPPLPQSMASVAVPLAPSPELVPIVESAATPNVSQVLESAVSGSIGTVSQALSTTENGGFDVLVTSVGFDEEDGCLVGNTDVDVVVTSYRDTPHSQSHEIAVYESGWSFWDQIDQFVGFPGLADLFDDKVKELGETVFVPLFDDQPVATVRMDLVERDSGACGGDDRYARLNVVIDPESLNLLSGTEVVGSDPSWYDVMPTAEILPAGGDPNRPLHCGRGSSGWGVCFQVVPAVPPQLCADFPAQFIDVAGGEDELASTEVQRVPASFAAVELGVTGGLQPFEPWAPGAYAVLDANGCLPAEYTPDVAQLTPASSDFLVTFTWRGSLIAPIGDTDSIKIQIDRVPGDDPSVTWTLCGETGTPFQRTASTRSSSTGTDPCYPYPDPCPSGGAPAGTLCYAPAASVHTEAAGGWSTGENRVALGTTDPDAPTVFSNAAAVAAHLLRLHVAEGTDLGIAPGTVHVWPESAPAFIDGSPYHTNSIGDATERYVHARPVWTSVDASGVVTSHEPDSARKFTLVHELTHAMQQMGAGNVGNGSYGFQLSGSWVTAYDPAGFPVECRCNHIGNEFSPWHCLNSVEPVGGASGEGYAHAMAARAFNDPDDANDDCWFLYVKDTLLPPNEDGSCPSGSLDPGHPGCIRVGSPEGQVLVNERYTGTDDRNRLLGELSGWYFIKAPARVSCSDAHKWRNNYCAEEVSAALAGGSPSAVEYLGTELDWLQFIWGLSRGTDAWTPTEFLGLQRAACAQRICSAAETWAPDCEPERCGATSVLATEAWRVYQELADARRPESLPITEAQWNLLIARGDQFGVSTNLQR